MTTRGSGFITLHNSSTATGNLITNDSSVAGLTGGSIGGVESNGFSHATLYSSKIGGNVSANNSSEFRLEGGDIAGSMTVTNSASGILRGGDVGESVKHTSAGAITITGTTIEGNVSALQQSTITINGADIFGTISAFGSARIILNGALLANVKPNAMLADGIGSSNLPLLKPADQSAFPSIFLNDDSSLEFDGHTLLAELIDPLNGGGSYSEYEISGLFADGTQIPSGLDLFVANGSTASFQLVEVPEPASAFLMTIAAIAILAHGRARRSDPPMLLERLADAQSAPDADVGID